MSQLYPHQIELVGKARHAWDSGARNVLLCAPTGAGKTVIAAHILRECGEPAISIAHRGELVAQKSLALARAGVRHKIIGTQALIKECVDAQLRELGHSLYSPTAAVGVASVDTLIRRQPDAWMRSVRLWEVDEAHHVLRKNKWGKAIAMFPNALGLGVTATPERADGEGLGEHASGVFQALVQGPGTRDLISRGYLTDYRVFAVPSDVDYSSVRLTASGDYDRSQLGAAVKSSRRITGDVVDHYLRCAGGKLGVTFAVSVEAAGELAKAYRAAGVPAEVVSAETPAFVRAQILQRFRRREILQLVNVDLFGEGFDLPAIEVVSMARKTASWPLFVQQFGRALRIMIDGSARGWGTMTDAERLDRIAVSRKPRALILDHVGNVTDGLGGGHGLPDAIRAYSLDSRERASRGDAAGEPPPKLCTNTQPVCGLFFPRHLRACPTCGHADAPKSRSAPEQVDGDLLEISPAALASLRGEISRIDDDVRVPSHLGRPAARRLTRLHAERQLAQRELRKKMSEWAGWQTHAGLGIAEIYRKFYLTFGTDSMTAQTLNSADAEKLTAAIAAKI